MKYILKDIAYVLFVYKKIYKNYRSNVMRNILDVKLCVNQQQENKIIRNIKIDYVYSFMRNFDISSAIWVLYMVYKGLPLWQVGIVEGIFHLASFLFEVPSGAIADLFGRKKTLIAGRICSALSAIVLLFSNSVIHFSIGFIISALSYNLNSGSEEALVYDSLKVAESEDKYLKVNSRLNIIMEVSQGTATFIGGILAEKSYVYCYAAVILISLISLIPCSMFKEPAIRSEKNESISLISHFKLCYKILRENKKILNILLYYPLIFTFNTVVFFYGQQYFSVLGCNKIQISLIMLLSGAGGCLGALTCEKVVRALGDNAKYAASMLMGISILFISGKSLPVSIIFFVVMSYANSLLYPIQSTSLNKLIPSAQRATIISIDSMIFSLSMICMFPICGLIADIFTLHLAFCMLGIIQIILVFILYKGNR